MTPTLALTRATDASQAFADVVAKAYADPLNVIISPALRIEMMKDPDIPPADHLIFTSVNGVACARQHGITAPEIWCVGDATAAAADGLGRIHNARGRAEDLINLIRRESPTGPMVHCVGAHQHGDVVQSLVRHGLNCRACVVYTQHQNPPTPELIRVLGGTAPVIAPVFSPRSGLVFAGLERQAILHGVAMSAPVAEALVDLGFDTVVTAAAPNAAAMVDATVKRLMAIKDARI